MIVSSTAVIIMVSVSTALLQTHSLINAGHIMHVIHHSISEKLQQETGFPTYIIPIFFGFSGIVILIIIGRIIIYRRRRERQNL